MAQVQCSVLVQLLIKESEANTKTALNSLSTLLTNPENQLLVRDIDPQLIPALLKFIRNDKPPTYYPKINAMRVIRELSQLKALVTVMIECQLHIDFIQALASLKSNSFDDYYASALLSLLRMAEYAEFIDELRCHGHMMNTIGMIMKSNDIHGIQAALLFALLYGSEERLEDDPNTINLPLFQTILTVLSDTLEKRSSTRDHHSTFRLSTLVRACCEICASSISRTEFSSCHIQLRDGLLKVIEQTKSLSTDADLQNYEEYITAADYAVKALLNLSFVTEVDQLLSVGPDALFPPESKTYNTLDTYYHFRRNTPLPPCLDPLLLLYRIDANHETNLETDYKHIFISYAPGSKQTVHELRKTLLQMGHAVWTDQVISN